MKHEHILSLSEIESHFPSPINTNEVHKKKLSSSNKIALLVTNHVGTMGFFLIVVMWIASWVAWNTIIPQEFRFDPFPAFVLLLFLTNILGLLLMPLIMVGQNIQGKHAELRSAYDYEVDKKSEKTIQTILLHLENQEEILKDLQNRLDKLEKKRK